MGASQLEQSQLLFNKLYKKVEGEDGLVSEVYELTERQTDLKVESQSINIPLSKAFINFLDE